MPILPISCKRLPLRIIFSASSVSPIFFARDTVKFATRSECPLVYRSLASSAATKEKRMFSLVSKSSLRAFIRSNDFIRVISSILSTGFTRKSSAPSSIAFSLSLCS